MKRWWIVFIYWLFRYEPHLMAARDKVKMFEELTGVCNSKLPKPQSPNKKAIMEKARKLMLQNSNNIA